MQSNNKIYIPLNFLKSTHDKRAPKNLDFNANFNFFIVNIWLCSRWKHRFNNSITNVIHNKYNLFLVLRQNNIKDFQGKEVRVLRIPKNP